MGLHETIAVVIPAVGVIVWLVRLEGRVNGHDQLLSSLREDVRYIRQRIDQAIHSDYADRDRDR